MNLKDPDFTPPSAVPPPARGAYDHIDNPESRARGYMLPALILGITILVLGLLGGMSELWDVVWPNN
jgi:hypothetical protein